MIGKTKVEFWGGFHSQMQPIGVWLDSRYVAESPLGALKQDEMARAKIMRHLCGMRDCMCDLHHGVEWQIL